MPVISPPTTTTEPLVNANDVVAYVGHDELDDATEAALVAQIALYQAELEGHLGRGVQRLDRTEVVPINAPPADPELYETPRWYARRGPVHSVAEITSGSTVLAATYYTRFRDGAVLLGGTMVEGTDLTVTYTGGWDTPDNLPAKLAIIARAGRWLNKRDDDDVGTESSSVEGHAVKWMVDAFTDAELDACSRLRSPDMAG